MVVNHVLVVFFAMMAIYFKDYVYIHNITNITNINIIVESSIPTNLRADNHYTTNINKICPGELIDNFAGKKGLYFNTTNQRIKKSILKRYFHFFHFVFFLSI